MRGPHRGDGDNVGDDNHHQGNHHHARISLLRVFDLAGHGGRVVPSHVVPHGNDDRSKETVFVNCNCCGVCREDRMANQRHDRNRNKRGEQQNTQQH